MGQIRILIVDDHPLMRAALRAAMESELDMQVIGEACDGQEALEQSCIQQPDVIVMDLLMPVRDGLSAMAALRQQASKAGILALTSSIDEGKVWQAMQAGALGYLLKDVQREELMLAIREVAQGHIYMPAIVSSKLVSHMRHQCNQTAESLTEREHQVLSLLAQGMSNREISEALCVSEGTTRTHVHNLLQKLGLKNRGQAILYAVSSYTYS